MASKLTDSKSDSGSDRTAKQMEKMVNDLTESPPSSINQSPPSSINHAPAISTSLGSAHIFYTDEAGNKAFLGNIDDRAKLVRFALAASTTKLLSRCSTTSTRTTSTARSLSLTTTFPPTTT
jgi:hypothetical protein